MPISAEVKGKKVVLGGQEVEMYSEGRRSKWALNLGEVGHDGSMSSQATPTVDCSICAVSREIMLCS